MNYSTANEKLGSRESRKLENNTYLQRRGEGAIAVKLHATDVLTFYADGSMREARIGHRMRDIQKTVQLLPGITAHAAAPVVYGQYRPRWSWVYAAFKRAASAGLVTAERVQHGTRKGQTIYWPVR